MISPTRPRSPTRTTSNIFAPGNPSAMTTGPETRATTPMNSSLRHGQRHAEHALREHPEALDLVLPAGGRHEDDERGERRLGRRALRVGERLPHRLAGDDEAELPRRHDFLELA